MKERLILISLMVTATAFAQVPRSDPAPVFPDQPTPGKEPPPLRQFGRTNIFNGPPGPRFTNSGAGRFTNRMATNRFFRMTNGNGRYTNFFGTNVPGLVQPTNGIFRGVTNSVPGVAPAAPAAPAAPNAPTTPEIPTLPGTRPTAPGVPPANPGVPPTSPNELPPNELPAGTPPNVAPPNGRVVPPNGTPPVRQPQPRATPVTPVK